MFELYNSCGREGVFYFLGGVLLKTGDTHVHFMENKQLMSCTPQQCE